MYAVIQTGGKQYRVSEGETLEVEKLPIEVGETIDLEQVLLLSNTSDVTVGQPFVEGARVVATVKAHGRGKKVIVYKHRKNYHKKQGHRQDFTRLQIEQILPAGASQMNLQKETTPKPVVEKPPVDEAPVAETSTPQLTKNVVDTSPTEAADETLISTGPETTSDIEEKKDGA